MSVRRALKEQEERETEKPIAYITVKHCSTSGKVHGNTFDVFFEEQSPKLTQENKWSKELKPSVVTTCLGAHGL